MSNKNISEFQTNFTNLWFIHPGDDPAVYGDDAVRPPEASLPGGTVVLHLLHHQEQAGLRLGVAEVDSPSVFHAGPDQFNFSVLNIGCSAC